MKPIAFVIGPAVAMFFVGACAENAKPPTTAQQSADQAEQAAQKAQKEAQEARKDERTAQQKREDAERTLRRKEAEERQAEQRAQQASYQAGHAEHRAASAIPPNGVAEAQATTMGHPAAPGQTNAGAPSGPAKAGKVIVVTAGLLFPTNSAELAPSAKPKLDELAAALRAKPEANDVIAKGYTDDRGRTGFNQALSERRAQAVKDYLASQGVPRDRIKTTGLGDASPAGTNKTVEGRAVNRRVEIIIRPASGQPGQ
ncbi:MAG: OmpA family protein [Polyangiaceae bacterium]